MRSTDLAEVAGERFRRVFPGSSNAEPRPSRRSAFDPGRRGLKALAVVAVIVVLAAAFIAWYARPKREPVLPAPLSSNAAQHASGAPSTVVVAVTGRVRKPGLVRLPSGARVADALEAAGGVLPGTDLTMVNLARRVNDGELIAIGVTAAQPGEGIPGKVNLNTATQTQLEALPGVGPVLAQRIIDHRTRRGLFRNVGDLRQVEGIGEAKFQQMKDLVTT